MQMEVSLSANRATGGRQKQNGGAGRAAAGRKAASEPKGGRAAGTARTGASGSGAAAKGGRAPLLDSRLKRELAGVLIAILAIALFIAVVAPGEAILSRAASDIFRLIIGLGAFALPFLMFVWAASFFIERDIAASAIRLAIGLGLIFVSVLSLLGLTTPNAAADPGLVFEGQMLKDHGGYFGGAIAWALLTLVGEGISFVILIGLMMVGAVLIGFSITAVVARVRGLIERRREKHTEEFLPGAYQLDAAAAGSSNSRRLRDGLLAATAQLGAEATPTAVLAPDAAAAAGGPGQGRDGAADDGLDGLDALGDLGSTRRKIVSLSDGALDHPDDNDLEKPDATVLLDGSPARHANRTPSTEKTKASARSAQASAQPTGGISQTDFKLPAASLLRVSRGKASTKAGESELRRTAQILQETIDQFGVDAAVEGWIAGPTVTLFKISLGEGVRLNKINALDEDIALALAAPAVRIFSPVPGTTLVGIEVPNIERSDVLLGDVLPFAAEGPLQLAVGKDVEGAAIVANLEKMPHLLIGGTTGSGKSVAINAMIMSVLMRATPAEVRMILIDPKMVELSLYNDIPHLYVPVVTDAQKAAAALAWGVIEMERRLKVFQKAGVKNIAQYNDYVRRELEKAAVQAERQAAKAAADAERAAAKAAADAERAAAERQAERSAADAAQAVRDARAARSGQAAYAERDEWDAQDGWDAEDGWDAGDSWDEQGAEDEPGAGGGKTAVANAAGPGESRAAAAATTTTATAATTRLGASSAFDADDELPEEMPLILIVIDELADLMMVAGKEVETSISRLAQLARAAGLHLIIATQRPSTNVITGLIKANIVNRIAFNVASGIDSRVILDGPGAEDLIGRGDLLFSRPEYGKPQRVQGCIVSEREIEMVVGFLKEQGAPEYHEDILATAVAGISTTNVGGFGNGSDDDPLVWEAADIVVSSGLGSTSTLQRRLKVGYARAGRIMDILEQKGVVGPPNGSKARDVLIDDILDLESLKAIEAADGDW
jgi:S-DNA-T family DNA segregation ATPase FtsK/SpoIIIE